MRRAVPAGDVQWPVLDEQKETPPPLAVKAWILVPRPPGPFFRDAGSVCVDPDLNRFRSGSLGDQRRYFPNYFPTPDQREAPPS